jgi:hypothetical protein
MVQFLCDDTGSYVARTTATVFESVPQERSALNPRALKARPTGSYLRPQSTWL